MERLGILGGSFDPIHKAHLYIAKKAKDELNLGKIIFMPVGSQPLKLDKKVTEASLRYRMVEKAIEGMEGFEVSDYEIEKQGLSYTFETLEHFSKKDREIYFITGGDCLMTLYKWREVEKIFKFSTLVVFTRPGYDFDTLFEKKKDIEKIYGGKIIVLDIKDMDISSTEVRNRIKLKEDIGELLPEGIMEIIKQEKLYGED